MSATQTAVHCKDHPTVAQTFLVASKKGVESIGTGHMATGNVKVRHEACMHVNSTKEYACGIMLAI